MSDDTTCEGFKNYATAAVAMVVDHERSARSHIRSLVWEIEDEYPTRSEVADVVRDYFECQMPELSGFWSSILRAGWEQVDWMELVEHWRDLEWRAVQ